MFAAPLILLAALAPAAAASPTDCGCPPVADASAPASQTDATATDTIDIQADSVSSDARHRILTAAGHVLVSYRGMTLNADRLRYDGLTQTGEAAGHLHVSGAGLTLDAERGVFDLRKEEAVVYRFKGRFADRAQASGAELRISRKVLELHDGVATPCLHPEPDLQLRAHVLRYYPQASVLNLEAEGAAVQVSGQDVLPLPSFSSTVGKKKGDWHSTFLPIIGYDAYQGLVTGMRFGFSFGDNSTGGIPVTFSTGRGWSAGLDHALTLPAGELDDGVRAETPWAGNRGGFRSLNSYHVPTPDGGRIEAAVDYRSDQNGEPVSRLPEVSWLPGMWHPWGLTFTQEARAGYLYEETSNVGDWRLRYAANLTTPTWTPLGWYQSFASVAPFVHLYAQSAFGGGQADWIQREIVMPDWSFSETLEGIKVLGNTPFFFDRQYDAARVRLQTDKSWGARLSTSLMVSFSEINDQPPFALEDLAFSTMYRWNCFAFGVTLHPLILGVDFNEQLLNF